MDVNYLKCFEKLYFFFIYNVTDLKNKKNTEKKRIYLLNNYINT